jgi:hypothetical protein
MRKGPARTLPGCELAVPCGVLEDLLFGARLSERYGRPRPLRRSTRPRALRSARRPTTLAGRWLASATLVRRTHAFVLRQPTAQLRAQARASTARARTCAPPLLRRRRSPSLRRSPRRSPRRIRRARQRWLDTRACVLPPARADGLICALRARVHTEGRRGAAPHGGARCAQERPDPAARGEGEPAPRAAQLCPA